jgi:hypothetical protein
VRPRLLLLLLLLLLGAGLLLALEVVWYPFGTKR